MKRKGLLLSLALIALSSLSSCANKGLSGEPLPLTEFMQPVEKGSYFRPNRGEWYSTYRNLRLKGGMGYQNEQYSEVTHIPTDKDGNPDYDNAYSYYAVTDVRALVVPVDFVGYEAEELPKGAEGTREDLRKAVFGEASDTNWHSLKSYYNKVSYGQCNITGEVTDWFHTNVSPAEFKAGKSFGPNKEYTGVAGQSAVRGLIRAVQEVYFGKNGQYDLDDFDANDDGVVDALLLIYSCPAKVDGSTELYWAFCGDSDAGQVNRFFWASYDTFWESNYNETTGAYRNWTREEIANGTAKIDCHTLIHEFGHVIGAPDYYDYDYQGKNPLGGADMMDYNVGDHNSLTKGWYGWTMPYIVEKNCSITINSTTDTGDFIIVPLPGKWYARNDKENKWDGTLLDQFLMLEFLTPTGVNEQEADHAYSKGYPVFYSEPAIRITHVDARIGMFDYDSNFKGYTIQTTATQSGMYLRTAATNTGGLAADTKGTSRASAYKDDRLITLVSSQEERRTWQARGADNGRNIDLFKTGDVLENYKFFGRSGVADVEFPWKITIGEIVGTEHATIKFSRV